LGGKDEKRILTEYKNDWKGKMRNAYVENIRVIGRER
jgi:hypothetical protein